MHRHWRNFSRNGLGGFNRHRTAIGDAAGGVISHISGGSFWEGAENGAFMGAIGGIIAGGLGSAMAVGGVLTLGETALIGGVSGAGSSLFSDLGDILIKGDDISFEQVLLNMGISGALGAAFACIGYGLSKAFTALKLKLFKPNVGGNSFADGMSPTDALKYDTWMKLREAGLTKLKLTIYY